MLSSYGEVSPIKWPSGPIQRPIFVHIPAGQALALMQPDTPAAKSFVWLKCSWGHTHQLGGAAGKTLHVGQGGPAVSAGNLVEQRSVETQLQQH